MINQQNLVSEFLELYIQKWESRKHPVPGELFSDYEMIFKKQPEVFMRDFDTLARVDGLAMALCAYHHFDIKMHEEYFSRLLNIFKEEVEPEVSRVEFLSEQEFLEAQNRRTKSKDFDSNEEEAEAEKTEQEEEQNNFNSKGKKVSVKFINIGILWKKLLLIWNENNRTEIEECVCEITQRIAAHATKLPQRAALAYINTFCAALIEADESIKRYPKVDMYIRTMYVLQKGLEPEHLAGQEVHYSEWLKIKRIHSFTKILLGEYVNALFTEQNYRALSSFLHKNMFVPYEEIYGITEEEFFEKMLLTQSERMVDCCLRMMGRESLSDLNRWKNMVEKTVTDEVCKSWFEWANYLFALELFLRQQEVTEEAFFEEAKQKMPTVDFPFFVTGTYKRITGAAIYIFGYVLEHGWDILGLVNLWGESNLFNFEKKRIYSPSPMTFEYENERYPWRRLVDEMMKMPMSIEEKLRVYMNSPLRFSRDFRWFVIDIAQEYGADRLEELFEPYPLDGRIRNIDKQTSAKSRLRFELNYSHVSSAISWKGVKNSNKVFNHRLLHVEENYYRQNERVLSTIKYGSLCTFKICGYEDGGINDGIVFIKDLTGGIYEEVDRKAEMEAMLEWMAEIRRTGEVPTVKKTDFQYVVHPKEVDLQKEFAESIFDTAFELRKTGMTRYFLGAIHQGRIDKVNDFLYQLNHKWVGKPHMKDFDKFKYEVRERANKLARDTYFNKQEKAYLYMNSCLKVFFSLAEFWRKAGLTKDDMVAAVNNEYDKFLFYVDFEGNSPEGARFRLNPAINIRIGIHGEGYRWLWEGQKLPEIRMGKQYRVSIKDIDIEKKTIWIDQVYGEKLRDPWEVYIRRIRDLKNSAYLVHIETIRKELEESNIDLYCKGRGEVLLSQFHTFMMLTVKKEYETYNLMWCRNVYTVLGDVQLFHDKKKYFEHYSVSEKERIRITEDFEVFMDYYAAQLQENPLAFRDIDLLDVYYYSPFNLVIPEEDFFASMKKHYGTDAQDLKARYEKEKPVM